MTFKLFSTAMLHTLKLFLLISSAELPASSEIRRGNASVLLNEPPPLPKSAPPGKAMSLQSDGQSVEDDDLDIPVQPKLVLIYLFIYLPFKNVSSDVHENMIA